MAANYNFYGSVPLGVNIEDNVNRALAYKATHTSQETSDWFFDVVRNNRNNWGQSKINQEIYSDPNYSVFIKTNVHGG